MVDWGIEYINDYIRAKHDGSLLCELTKEKGRILLSRKSFKKGEVIFKESPLHIVAEFRRCYAYCFNGDSELRIFRMTPVPRLIRLQSTRPTGPWNTTSNGGVRAAVPRL